MSAHELPYPGPRRPRLRDDLIAYLRRPRATVASDSLPSFTWAKLLALQFLSLILAAPLMAIGFGLVSEENYTADEGIPGIWLFVLAVAAAPLLEETAFRLALTRFNGAFLIIGGVVLAIVSGGLIPELLPVMLVISLALVILGVAGLWSRQNAERIGAWWERHFATLFYGSAVVFALYHLANYDFGGVSTLDVIAAPLLVTAQFLGGILMGYCRVRLGIFPAMGQHAAYNAVLVGPAILAGGVI